MSADQQRLNSAIQRISEQSPRIRELLKASDNKGGRPGSVGIGLSEAEETRICCDGSTSGNANPGSGETDPDGDGAGQDGGLNSDDPALLDNGAGELSGVTNCATGQPICFSGSGFIPPDGWDDPNSPPPIPEYIDGTYFVALTYPDTCTSPSPFAVGDCVCAELNNDYCILRDNGDDTYTVRSTGGAGIVSVTDVVRRTCAITPDPACNEDPPTEDAWPGDGCANLAIVNGSIVGSKYDPENDGSYSAPVQEREVCDAVTGDPILLRVDTNSTYKSIKSLEGDIDPDTQAGYLYNTNTGQRIRQISPSEFRDPTV